MEKKPTIETPLGFSPEKAELIRLQNEGKYLFSGKSVDVEQLEPRQAVDAKTGPDGEPAVFASNEADFAIFMAIVTRANCPQGVHAESGAVFKSDGSYTLKFGMTAETKNQLQESAYGWVYVLNKSDFAPHPTKEGVEFVTHKPVTPVRKIRVSKRDLPETIEIHD